MLMITNLVSTYYVTLKHRLHSQGFYRKLTIQK